MNNRFFLVFFGCSGLRLAFDLQSECGADSDIGVGILYSSKKTNTQDSAGREGYAHMTGEKLPIVAPATLSHAVKNNINRNRVRC